MSLPSIYPPYPERGVVFVLSGPSGVGKDAVLQVVHSLNTSVERILTATTRAPRENEVDGVDYHFWTVDEFRRHIDNGHMLEWAEVYGNLYGTPRAQVDVCLSAGRSAVLKIDVQGAATIRRALPESVHIFIVPPSLEALENRLRARGTDSDDAIRRRLAKANTEMQRLPEFDYVVVNDDLQTAAEEVAAVLLAERRRVTGLVTGA